MTQPVGGPPSASAARRLSTRSSSAETSTGVTPRAPPATTRRTTAPSSTKRKMPRSSGRTSPGPRPMKRFTERTVSTGRSGAPAPGRRPHLDGAVGAVVDRRGEERAPLVGGDDPRPVAGVDVRHQRVGGPEVDADGEPALVRLGGLARFGDLQERTSRRCLSGMRRGGGPARRRRWPRGHRRSRPRSCRGTGACARASSRRRSCGPPPSARARNACISVRDSPISRRSPSSAFASCLARPSSTLSRHSICCMRKSGGIEVLDSSPVSKPLSARR